MKESQYFVYKDDQQSGPFSVKELLEALQLQRIALTDLVWKEGLGEWMPLSSIVPPPPPKGTLKPSTHGANDKAAEISAKAGYVKIIGYALFLVIVISIIGTLSNKESNNVAKDENIDRRNETVIQEIPNKEATGERLEPVPVSPTQKTTVPQRSGEGAAGADRRDSKASPVESGSGKTVNESKVSIQKMDEPFKLGDFTYVIKSAQKTSFVGNSQLEEVIVDAALQEAFKQIGAKPAADAPTYLIVRYAIKNDGRESAVVSTSDFKVEDSRGRVFSPSSEATAQLVMNGSANFLVADLQPGVANEGVQAFELPNESFRSAITLIVPEKGVSSKGEVRVKLAINKL
jgi:Domain of unknown function (DUF4352)/GYF domain 2